MYDKTKKTDQRKCNKRGVKDKHEQAEVVADEKESVYLFATWR